MINKIINFIHKLRIYFLIFFAVSFFYYLGSNPINLSRYLGARFSSAVGLSVSVPANPINKVALQLKQKEDLLNQREKILNKNEQELKNYSLAKQNIFVWILGGGLLVLLFLILLNYYLDYHRRNK